MDTDQIYVMQWVSDERVFRFPELVIVRALEAMRDPDYPQQTHVLCCTMMKGWPEYRNVPVGALVSDMGALGFAYVDPTGEGQNATVRCLALTVENFGVFKEYMVGWAELAAQFTTTDALRAYFRAQLSPLS